MSEARLLVSAYFDGVIDRDQFATLCAWIRADAANAALFAEWAMLNAHVRDHFRWDEAKDYLVDPGVRQDGSLDSGMWIGLLEAENQAGDCSIVDITDKLEEQARASQRGRLHPRRKQAGQTAGRHIVIPRALVYMGLAAMIALLVLAASFSWKDMPAARPVAKLTRAVDAKWAHKAQPGAGDSMMQGRYELVAGIIELRLQGGAGLVIEAPARFALDSDNAAELTLGKLVGHCPPGSEGLTIRTPTARVVDLGTEFGLEVLQSGETRAHVFAGRISLSRSAAGSSGAAAEIIEVNQARIVDSRGEQIRPTESQPQHFVRHEEMAVLFNPKTPYHRWLAHSYQLRRDPSLIAYYTFEEADADRTARNLAAATWDRLEGVLVGDPERIEGRFAQTRALRLRRERDEYVRISHDDALNVEHAITIAAWIRRPNGALGGHLLGRRDRMIAYQMAAFGERADDRPHATGRLGFQWLTAARDGGVESLYVNDVFQWDDPQWRQVAVVDDGSTVRFYLDGQLIDQRNAPTRRIDMTADLCIGSSGERRDRRSFDGDIDEILIFSRALSDADMLALYRAGSPP